MKKKNSLWKSLFSSVFNGKSILLLVIYSCVNRPDNLSEVMDSEDVIDNRSYLYPDSLMVSSSSHDLLLNRKLFEEINLPKGTYRFIKATLVDELLRENTDFYSDESELSQLRSGPAKRSVELRLSFVCKKCKDAYLIRSESNNLQLSQDIKDGLLDIDGSKEWRINTDEGGVYSDLKIVRPNKSGWRSFYVVLRDSSNSTRIFELASFLYDDVPPKFINSNIFLTRFQGNKDFEGLVCLETKEFEGNDYEGYDVPFKGKIFGDVKSLSISGRRVKLEGEDFFQRVHLRLRIGYNQVPIVILDSIGNINETYMEITLERISSQPYIENNIYN